MRSLLSSSSQRSLSRPVVGTATALVLAAALVGCGSDSSSSDKDADADAAPKAEVLTELEATAALMVEANLGGLFTTEEDDDDDNDAPGCMKGVADVLGDDDDAETTAERSYSAVDPKTNTYLSNKVLSYATAAEAEQAVADILAVLEDCTAVSESDDDGFSYELEVTSDDDKSEDAVDDQVNALASGTISAASGGSGDVALRLSLVRVGNNITAVTASTLDSELPGPITDLVAVMTGRLAAVVAGKKPDDSVVAGA